MASSDKELEQQLLEAGNKLVAPPSSVDELLPLIDQVESCLLKVEQSPTQSMQDALAPSLQALVADEIFRHMDVDVKVAVASCISEITRITAPDAPYDDEKMKDVFQLIVSSFEDLADKSSRSYSKRTSILETVAKVRSCVVMLDLECDALIIEMFQHFLKAIRDHHPENVFTSMETIMTLVLEESEEISLELLSPILESVKKGNEGVLPVAQKLGEKVLQSCAAKVKPALIGAVRSSGISLDDYSDVVASICRETSVATQQNDADAVDENKVEESKPVGTSSGNTAQADKEMIADVASTEQDASAKSPKSGLSNGVTQTGEGDSLADKDEAGNHADKSKSIEESNIGEEPSKAEPDIEDSEKVVNAESNTENISDKSGKKVTSSKSTEVSESSHHDNEKEADKQTDDSVEDKDVSSPPKKEEEPSAEAVLSSEIPKAAGSQPSSPKALEGESDAVNSPSVSENLPDESHTSKDGRSKKKENLIKESAPSSDNVPIKASDLTSDVEAKQNKRSGRKTSAGVSIEDGEPMEIDASKKETDTASESEAKSVKQSSKKVEENSNNGDGSSLKQSEDKKQRSQGKASSRKVATKSSTKVPGKEKLSSPKSSTVSTRDEHLEETPKTGTKRKSAGGKEKDAGSEDYESLVGLRVEVWWPQDKTYYRGTIESYDHVKKKHKVAYDDGDEEVLNLKREKWKVLPEEEEADQPSPDASPEMPLKKKAKSSDQSTKQKIEASPRKAGSSSSKSRTAATKSSRKGKESGKSDAKSLDDKKVKRREEEDDDDDSEDNKSKDHSRKSGGKSADVSSKTAKRSKNDDTVTSKGNKSKEDITSTPKSSKSKQETQKSGKSKQETGKATSATKAKLTKSGGKSDVNGSGKLKSGSSKVKESEESEDSTDSDKVLESLKGKSGSATKGSEMKSGKKRRRA